MKIRVRILPNGIVKRNPRFSTLWFFDKAGKFIYCQSCYFKDMEDAISQFIKSQL
jgi:hypothetical protein